MIDFVPKVKISESEYFITEINLDISCHTHILKLIPFITYINKIETANSIDRLKGRHTHNSVVRTFLHIERNN